MNAQVGSKGGWWPLDKKEFCEVDGLEGRDDDGADLLVDGGCEPLFLFPS